MPENQDESFFTVNVAYTTPSGRMHIGHGLGHTISDVALRYGALRSGSKMFFGFGMHSTGKDLIKILQALGEDDNLAETLQRYNISKAKRDEILSLAGLSEQVDALVVEYQGQYEGVIKRMGIAMNFDSFFSTNREANQRYTQWTLRKLEEAGLIVETESERPYCQKCDDIKHIDKDLSEVSAVGKVDWDKLRVADGQIYGGEFECKLHSGEKVIVKSRKERAINYANQEMHQRTIELASEMQVFPRKYKCDLEGIVRTRLAKPFERKVDENVGAISPFDSTKRVEALSDSNIYMEFYAISQLVNQGKLQVENLTEAFFDYVYQCRGDPDEVAKMSGLERKTLDRTKSYIEAVYPVNISVAGFEHIEVHVPFSLFTHAAVLPKRFFFPEYIITSHITKNGEKMSKSKGNVVYLDDLLELTKEEGRLDNLSTEASFDTVRFFLSYYQSLDRDFDWNDEIFRNVGLKGVQRYVRNLVSAAEDVDGLSDETSLNQVDKWFSTINQRTIRDITRRMDEKDTRGALVTLVDIRRKALSSYMSSDNPKKHLLFEYLLSQINMSYPVMPRITEELRQKHFSNSQLEWPSQNFEEEFSEDYECVEHQLRGKDYERDLSGLVNATLGKMLGRKEITLGESISIVTPTRYQMQVLQKLKIPLSKKFNINFSADPSSVEVEVKK